MIDSDIYIYEKRTKLVVADLSERKKWSAIGLRSEALDERIKADPSAGSNALKGKRVRPRTLSIIRQTADRLLTEL
jgi:hypothetical protein